MLLRSYSIIVVISSVNKTNEIALLTLLFENTDLKLTSGNNHKTRWKGLQPMCICLTNIYWEHSAGCLMYDFVFQVINKKSLPAIWETYSYENICNYNSNKFSYKLIFISPFCCFVETKTNNRIFQKVDGRVTKNVFVFDYSKLQFYFKDMANSTGFFQGSFLHIIPVCIIVSWGQHHIVVVSLNNYLFIVISESCPGLI